MSTTDLRVILQEVDGHVVVPLHDPVDDRVLDATCRKLLEHMHQRGPSAVVLDLSGVEVLDGHDFEKLRQLSQALNVMGGSVILAGMGPGVAAGLVALDVDDRWARTALNVSRALASQ